MSKKCKFEIKCLECEECDGKRDPEICEVAQAVIMRAFETVSKARAHLVHSVC